MDRLRPAILIAALVVDVGRRLPRRGGSAMPPYARRCRGEGGRGLDRLERGWVDAHADLGAEEMSWAAAIGSQSVQIR